VTLQRFIDDNRAELVQCISRVLDHVPATASCSCPKSRTDHYHNDSRNLDDDELRLWILNDEGLYNWSRSEGVREDEEGDDE
jgi:hypothetical protein